ncbi:ANTAR domain-containing protein [Knoellia sp. Soil729]|uniref:ANTAR domain-containing protein n=1 Tax=Knoellia sp. Soil729 TaxID=1736394 RepID=UPI0009EC51CE|nr:ANTAR domain-containing protein [Knoellia sp. Soil729]
MNRRTPTQALAHAAGALVQATDVAHVLAVVIEDAADLMRADAIGLLVRGQDDALEVLTATSHRAHELELLQAQQAAGPCVDCFDTAAQVVETTGPAIEARWPSVGPQIVAAGYTAVHTFPMCWQDQTLGAMNVFHSGALPEDIDLAVVGQAFADIATAVTVQGGQTQVDPFERVMAALAGRTLIEQAKGVLAYQEGIDMDQAYDRLRSMADDETSLSNVARRVIDRAVRSER